MSPVDNWDGPLGAVFTGADSTWLLVLFSLVAFALFIVFMVRMVLHENHAYAAIVAHEPVEPGPVVEGEPPVY